MTAHLHSALVPGCFRCELGKDEETAALQDMAEQAAREAACSGHSWTEHVTGFGHWDECIHCGAEVDR